MVGFRYDPTDEELMKILMKKVNNAEQTHLNHHFNFIVNDSEIYGKIPPWEIYDSHNDYHLHTFHRKLYVFTDLKTTTGNRVCRAAACGDIPTKQAIAPTVSLSLRLRLRLKIPSFCLCIFIDNCVFFFLRYGGGSFQILVQKRKPNNHKLKYCKRKQRHCSKESPTRKIHMYM